MDICSEIYNTQRFNALRTCPGCATKNGGTLPKAPRAMSFRYQFSNLCGTVYSDGNVVFTADGNTVISPVGNRCSVFNLSQNIAYTLPCENRQNIACIALSPNNSLLLTIDVDGHALLINFPRRIVLHHFNFKSPVRDAQFSPDGMYIAVTFGRHIKVWKTPSAHREFAPFELHRTFANFPDEVTCLDWTSDSQFLIGGCQGMTSRIFSTHTMEAFEPIAISGGHRGPLVAVFFASQSGQVYTVSQDGMLIVWQWASNDHTTGNSRAFVEGHMIREAKHFFKQNGKVTCATLHKPSNMLVVGFSNGVFELYDLPSFSLIHALSVSQKCISTVAINATGEWLTFGASLLGQLVVWEWQSESYILKQQGHYFDTNCLSYSPDGQWIATGGDDGKVKVWQTSTGFCFVTFTEHEAAVTDIQFASRGSILLSSSMDGTVRAFDMLRYRNFRTFVTPEPVQLTCLSMDAASEIVCAGSTDTFEIFCWSMQTGKLIERLGGHEGPISAIQFAPLQGLIVSSSWDKTVRVWNLYSSRITNEILTHNSDVLDVAFSPTNKQICSATMDGQLWLWDPYDAMLIGTIDCRHDVGGGRGSKDKVSTANLAAGKFFTSVCYSADGQWILAGGKSKFVCIYNVNTQSLVTRFPLSRNLSMEGVLEFLNSKGHERWDIHVTIGLRWRGTTPYITRCSKRILQLSSYTACHTEQMCSLLSHGTCLGKCNDRRVGDLYP